jgi:hypothetical protein
LDPGAEISSNSIARAQRQRRAASKATILMTTLTEGQKK